MFVAFDATLPWQTPAAVGSRTTFNIGCFLQAPAAAGHAAEGAAVPEAGRRHPGHGARHIAETLTKVRSRHSQVR